MYEDVKRFEKETPEKVKAGMRSLNNETIDIMIDYLNFYKTDFILSAHRIKNEPGVEEYKRGAISSIDVMASLLAGCKKQTTHKDKIVGKTQENKKPLEK